MSDQHHPGSPAALWEARSRDLEPVDGPYCYYNAWREWVGRPGQDYFPAVWGGMGELERIDLFCLFVHAATGGPPHHAGPYPQPQTDAERLAVAVLRGDGRAALMLADEVTAAATTEDRAGFVGRAELEATVTQLRTQLGRLAWPEPD